MEATTLILSRRSIEDDDVDNEVCDDGVGPSC